MISRLALIPFLTFVLAASSHAQTHTDKLGTVVPGFSSVPNLGTGAYKAATIGTTDAIILAAGSAFYILDFVNLSQSATVCLNFGATATISGTTCAAGEIAIPPLYHRSWDGVFIPTDALHAVASSASTPASVGAK